MVLLFLLVLFDSNSPSLVLDGTIGGEDLILDAGVTVAANDQGDIYLMDPGSFRMLVFDRDLQQVRSFGRKGKGPGEFEEPKTVVMTPDNKPAVFDPTLKRLTIFEPDGTPARILRLDVSSVAIYHPAVLADDRTVFLSARAHEGKPVYDLSIYESDTTLAKNLVRIESEPMDWSQSSKPAFWVKFLAMEMGLIGKGMPVSCGLDAQTFVHARSDRYELNLVDAKGKLLKKITHKVKPLPLTEEAKMAAFEAVWDRLTLDPYLANNMPQPVFDRAAARAEAPPALPLIKAVSRYGDGFAVLALYDEYKKKGRLDLFDRNGELKKSIPYTGAVSFITGNKNHLFVIGPGQDEEIRVKRLRIQ